MRTVTVFQFAGLSKIFIRTNLMKHSVYKFVFKLKVISEKGIPTDRINYTQGQLRKL